MKAHVLCLCLIAGGAAASEAPLPRYDVAKHCRSVSDSVGGSAMIENGCVTQEQEAYDALKATWPRQPARIRSHCDNVARAIGGSYTILKGCIEQEAEATREAPVFRY